MPDNTTRKALPKSLHTVTVFVRIAKDVMRRHPGCDARAALIVAQVILGLEDTDDVHRLTQAALKQLEAQS